ncbi:MAG: hypothetical protein IPK16_20545 [Anaerolineales bacterium]|nr:hypothetical protein [Anaerolineales bacterium]
MTVDNFSALRLSPCNTIPHPMHLLRARFAKIHRIAISGAGWSGPEDAHRDGFFAALAVELVPGEQIDVVRRGPVDGNVTNAGDFFC